MNRNITIAASVVLLHVVALWALQTGLLRRVAELVVPAEILVAMMPAPVTDVAKPTPPKAADAFKPKVAVAPVVPAQAAPKTIAPLTPLPLAAQEPAPQPSATAPTGVTTSPAPHSTTLASSGAPSGAPSAMPAKVELPSSDADYLNNPKPPYPSLSKRLGEQGRVLVRTLIGADGVAQKAEIKQSSGFDRLDQAALATALRWRYVPGKRAGVAEAMWFNVPFNFVLE